MSAGTSGRGASSPLGTLASPIAGHAQQAGCLREPRPKIFDWGGIEAAGKEIQVDLAGNLGSEIEILHPVKRDSSTSRILWTDDPTDCIECLLL